MNDSFIRLFRYEVVKINQDKKQAVFKCGCVFRSIFTF